MIQLSIPFPLFSSETFRLLRERYKELEYTNIQKENAYLRNRIRGYKGYVEKLRIKI